MRLLRYFVPRNDNLYFSFRAMPKNFILYVIDNTLKNEISRFRPLSLKAGEKYARNDRLFFLYYHL